MLDRPVFIIGAARSGTTMLGEILALHPDVAYWLEPKYIWRYGAAASRTDVRTAEEVSEDIRNYITNSFSSFLDVEKKSRFVEKTPSNVFRIPFIYELFPNGRFIHLLRDGRDVALSAEIKWTSRPDRTALYRRLIKMEIPLKDLMHYGRNFLRDVFGRIFFPGRGMIWGPHFEGIDAFRKTHSVLETCAQQWLLSVEACQKEFSKLPMENVFTLKYEDFLENPSSQLIQILKFCELDQEALEHMLKDFEPKAKKIYTLEEKAKIERINHIIADKLIELDYI